MVSPCFNSVPGISSLIIKPIKFVDNTTLIGLIINSDKSAYRRQVVLLVSWCTGKQNWSSFYKKKAVEGVTDFPKRTSLITPLKSTTLAVSKVKSVKLLSTSKWNISKELKWEINTSAIIRNAHQWQFLFSTKYYNKYNWPLRNKQKQ